MVFPPKVAIVILNWNGCNDTLECLRSVSANEYANFETVVVDNGSTDNSVEVIKAKFPEVCVVETGENLGYAGGNNVGIERALVAGAEFILVLNNDAVIAPDALGEFVRAAREFPDAAAFCGRIYEYENPKRIWWDGSYWIDREGRFISLGNREFDFGSSEEHARETDYACGCAMFIRSKIVKEIGLLDPLYFLLFEETDWCYRARQKGYRSLVVPKVRIWHKGSASFGGDDTPLYVYFFTRNRLLFAERHLGVHSWLLVWRRTLIEISRWAVGSVLGCKTWRERYWAVRTLALHGYRSWNVPVFHAIRLGMRDYLLRRFGDCPDIVRMSSSMGRKQKADV